MPPSNVRVPVRPAVWVSAFWSLATPLVAIVAFAATAGRTNPAGGVIALVVLGLFEWYHVRNWGGKYVPAFSEAILPSPTWEGGDTKPPPPADPGLRSLRRLRETGIVGEEDYREMVEAVTEAEPDKPPPKEGSG